jgi:hypothetical protein
VIYQEQKGVFAAAHAIPLEYWITTRMIGGYYVAVMHRFGWQLLLLVLTGAGLRDGMAFLLSWLTFKVAYELGYIMNDFWSEGREGRQAGDRDVESPPVSFAQMMTLCAPRPRMATSPFCCISSRRSKARARRR